MRVTNWKVGSAAVVLMAALTTWAASAPVTTPVDSHTTGSQPTTSTSELKELQARIKALREDLRSQIDPLEAQIKALRDKYDPQIKDLEQRRSTLVEQGKPTSIQQLDQQEQAEMAALVDREKDEIAKVREQIGTERKAIQQKYDERRKELRSEGQ